MAETEGSPSGAIDAGQLLDRGRWTRYQKFLIFATAVTIVLDGVDNQLLPNAVPTLIQEWGRPRREFTNALAIGPFGMMLGGLFGGIVGDRWGRRPALLGSVLTFGAFTTALAFVNSIEALAVVRFLAGLGLGGAMPNAATLASEYVPARNRPLAVTLTIVSILLAARSPVNWRRWSYRRLVGVCCLGQLDSSRSVLRPCCGGGCRNHPRSWRDTATGGPS